MIDWLLNNFTMFYGNLTVFESSGDLITCNGDWLGGQLNSCTIPPTYEELSALSIAQQGWQKVFDQWKERGIVQ